VKWMSATQIVGVETPHRLQTTSEDDSRCIEFGRLIIATGARERFIPFPGWTLPGVMGVGGLQALARSGWPIRDRRVVIAGTGPLLWAAAAYLSCQGAKIVRIAEQAPMRLLVRFGLQLVRYPDTLKQAAGLAGRLRGVPFESNCWPVGARGSGHVKEVALHSRGMTRTEPCDYLAVGFHLVPNLELAMLLGCDTRDGVVETDEWQATSVDGVYAAGEATGVGGLQRSLAEGRIAGLAATDGHAEARRAFAARARGRRFGRLVADTFRLRDELRALPQPDTIVCRCEDVTWGRIRDRTSWRDAKLQTRCGMGPCQARVCGPALQYLRGWSNTSVRPPVLPTRVADMMNLCTTERRT
jgi:NADPH-dependent 2,4-dienoyl-CoA reductase/sulfur reductase-like enzyme